MPFRPCPGDEIRIGNKTYRVTEHPNAPGMVYGQTGRRGTVYQLIDQKDQAWALKVFLRQFREPRLVGQAERIQNYVKLPGLRACERQVFTGSKQEELLHEHPELSYAVLMPWIKGQTWMEILMGGELFTPQEVLKRARSFATVLLSMEERGLAHCDLSGPNVILTTDGGVELVDLEEMYGPSLIRPKSLPGGSPGYAHKTAPEGLWRDEVDRFAGAVLLSEILGWCDERVREAVWGEGCFDPDELQTNCDRFHLMASVLHQRWGERIAEQFKAAWSSDTLSMCPTFTEWLVALPKMAPDDTPVEIRLTEKPKRDVDALILKAEQFVRDGETEKALSAYREAFAEAQGEIRDEIAVRIEELSEQVEKDADGWNCSNCGRYVSNEYEICPYCERRKDKEDIESELEPVEPIIAPTNVLKEASRVKGKRIKTKVPTKRLNWKIMFSVIFMVLGVIWLALKSDWYHLGTPINEIDSAGGITPDEELLDDEILSTNPFAGPVPDGALMRLGKGDVSGIVFSPTEDVLIVSSSVGIYFYRLNDLSFMRVSTVDTPLSCIAISPDGETLASGSGDGTVILWDTHSGKRFATLEGHTKAVMSVAFSPDSEVLASGSTDDFVILWDARSGERLATLDGHSDRVNSVAFSPDGETLASGSWDNTLILWDALKRTGERLATLGDYHYERHTQAVMSVAFSHDGETLAWGWYDGTVILWDTYRRERLATLEGHTGPVNSVAFSPDGKTLASGSRDDTVILWDARSWEQLATLKGHTDDVSGVAFSPDGETLASGSRDDTVIFWDARSGERLATLGGYTTVVNSIAYSPDGEILASGSRDDTVILWGTHSGERLATLEGHTDSVYSVAFSPDGETLASGSRDDTVILWDARSGKRIATIEGHTSDVRSVAFSPDGETLASGSWDGTVILWDAHSGNRLTTLEGYSIGVHSVVFSPDSETLALGSSDDTVIIWDVYNGEQLAILRGHNSDVASVAFSPDGETLASGSSDDTVILWDVRTGERLATLEGHPSSVMSVAFSPDGDTLASGLYDGIVILWGVRSGEWLTILKGHTSVVESVAFSPDGETLASGSEDGTVMIWDVDAWISD